MTATIFIGCVATAQTLTDFSLPALHQSALPVFVVPSSRTASGFAPRPALNSTVVTGGVAIIIAIGPLNGGNVFNPPNLASQGIGAAETGYIDMVTSPGSTDATANGTCYAVATGTSFTLPPLAPGIIVRLNAATSGHKFSIEIW